MEENNVSKIWKDILTTSKSYLQSTLFNTILILKHFKLFKLLNSALQNEIIIFLYEKKSMNHTVTRLFFASWQISRFSVSKISRLEIFAHWGYLNFASFLACYRNIIQYLIKVQKRVIKHVFWGRSNQCPVSKINAVNWLTTVWHELSIALHRSVCRKCCSNRDEHNA